MKLTNQPIIAQPLDMNGDLTTPAVYLGNVVNFSIQLVFGGVAPTGTFYLQCSNDPAPLVNTPTVATQDSQILNWTDITTSHQNITEAGNHTWNVENCGFMWVRVAYAYTSGTGELSSARITIKGV